MDKEVTCLLLCRMVLPMVTPVPNPSPHLLLLTQLLWLRHQDQVPYLDWARMYLYLLHWLQLLALKAMMGLHRTMVTLTAMGASMLPHRIRMGMAMGILIPIHTPIHDRHLHHHLGLHHVRRMVDMRVMVMDTHMEVAAATVIAMITMGIVIVTMDMDIVTIMMIMDTTIVMVATTISLHPSLNMPNPPLPFHPHARRFVRAFHGRRGCSIGSIWHGVEAVIVEVF